MVDERVWMAEEWNRLCTNFRLEPDTDRNYKLIICKWWREWGHEGTKAAITWLVMNWNAPYGRKLPSQDDWWTARRETHKPAKISSQQVLIGTVAGGDSIVTDMARELASYFDSKAKSERGQERSDRYDEKTPHQIAEEKRQGMKEGRVFSLDRKRWVLPEELEPDEKYRAFHSQRESLRLPDLLITTGVCVG